jgi:hypothetical protein
MALDSPLLRDGSQHVAFANFFNPAVPLAGPGGSGQFLAVAFQASRVLQIASAPTSIIYGVLQNTPTIGLACDVGIGGISKMVAGAGITFGAELMIDSSGRFITWVAGAANFKVGMAMETVGAVNQVFTGLIYVPNYKVVT